MPRPPTGLAEYGLDLAGLRFGMLLVLGDAPKGYRGNRMLRCRCDCGADTVTRREYVVTLRTRSCGCYRKEFDSDISGLRGRYQATHGCSSTRTYRNYRSMISRCCNPNASGYPRYGGRGIRVCERWRHSYENFAADMGEAPDGKSIDRIDNDAGYLPENCRWATARDQMNNRGRFNVRLDMDGESRTLAEWCTEYGMNYQTVRTRIAKGWSLHRALIEVPDQRRIKKSLRREQAIQGSIPEPPAHA